MFILYGLLVSAVLAALVWPLTRVLARLRPGRPLPRGRRERLLVLLAPALVAAAWLAYAWRTSGAEFSGTIVEELLGMLGPALVMPAAAAIGWGTGELASGPTARPHRSLAACLGAAQLGFLGGCLLFMLAGWAIGRWTGDARLREFPAWLGYLLMAIPYACGALASAGAYLLARGPVAARWATEEEEDARAAR